MATSAFPLDNFDQTPVLPAAPEELAGPPHSSTAPVTQAERISAIDTLRGISLMGILVMNCCDFAYGFKNYAYPLSIVKPVFNGPHWHLDTTLWFLRWILAEGKMRALFSMLFGAGVILLTGRAEKRGAGVRAADIFCRRNMWLLLFGMLHCYLIWNGDILYFYGSCALFFLFPMRNLKPKTLFIAGSIILAFNTLLVSGGQTAGVYFTQKKADAAMAAKAAHKPLTESQNKVIEAEHNMEDAWRPSEKSRYKDIEAHHGYGKAFIANAPDAFQGETIGPYAGFGDWLGMMMLGMAFFRNGFFTLKLSTRAYALFTLIGLGISWPLIAIGAYKSWRGGFDHLQTMLWLQLPYDIGRVSGAIGTAALILLLLRFGAFKFLLARCAAVGQMALSNYILTSLTFMFLFVWSPLHWYGYLDYYKVYELVVAMWLVNMTWSTIWLRYFRFGPIEWLWRSLTYWQRQPMLLHTPVGGVASPLPESVA